MRFFFVFWIIVFFFLSNIRTSQANTPVFFSFVFDGDTYNFEGGFSVKADTDIVWSVLTDYNHVSRFISNMHSSVKKDDGDDLLVEQDAGGGFLIIQEHIKALLSIHEDPLQSISFDDVSHKDFELYSGVWHLWQDPAAKEVKVIYELQAVRGKKTPNFLTADLFGGSLGDLLFETQREISKRQLQKEKKSLESVIPTVSIIASPTAVQMNNRDSE